ncbi:hypothetical protein ACFYXS_09735 [Streptomyces sp. NPDC002574]|uniref:hypothetical protein n=1 Tax=Streptomyces sp. NPDC002574 TaxID=3364652 RepID=UPI003695A63D
MSAPTVPAFGGQRPGAGSGFPGGVEPRPSHLPLGADRGGAAGEGAARRTLRAAFGLLGPRRDRHTMSAEQLSGLSLPIGDDGVVIGVDAGNQPAVLALSRPARLDVLLIGSMWLAQVLSLRAAATGARVAVETARPQSWAPMAQAAGGGQQCVTVHEVGRIAPQGPSVQSPVVIVRDCGARPPRSRVAAQSWQSVMTLLPYLGPTAPRLLSSADVVGLQRVSPQEAEVIGQVMGLADADVAALPTLGDNVTMWCTRKHRQFVMTQPTDAESGLLGPARRVD